MSYRCAIYNRKCELLILKSQNVGKVYVKPRLLKPKKTCVQHKVSCTSNQFKATNVIVLAVKTSP